MNYIHITNLKNIKELFFEIPNKPGSYLLTGTNGVGKTTLLICLARIKIVGIFNTNFRPNDNVKIDQFENSIIEFSVKGESVKYSYGGERWVPTQKGKTVLNDFGFPQVKYFQANASRIETVPKDLLNDKNKKIDEKTY
ncbi:MAG: hypothetical protein IPQ05_13475 [Leptospiraceae bacterium]|nr:hypothetical protein [Leptospiraceae bacterium]